MKRKFQLMMKYVILGSVLIVLIAGQFVLLYAFEKRERSTTTIFYIDPNTSQSVSYDKKFIIATPTSYTGRLPVVIMLHGDLVDDKSMNFLKTEFVRMGFMVVLMNLDFTYQSFFEIDAVVNYLLIQSNVDDTQIGIIGHSHGAHFAFWYAKLHDDVIQGVIMENMGTVSQLYDDYYEYYNNFINTAYFYTPRDYSANFTETIGPDDPKNLLIITDNYQPARATEANEIVLTSWEFDQQNVQTGSFENGTARELNTEFGFFHGSGLYNPNVIQKNIDWMSRSFGLTLEENPITPISLRVYGYIVLLGGVIVISSIFLVKGLNSIPYQLRWIKHKLYSRRKNKTNDISLEVPKLLKVNPRTEIRREDIFRLERRFSSEFDFIYDTADYFRVIIITIVGTHLFLYLLELIVGENSLYYVGQTSGGTVFNAIFAFNDTLNDTLFTHPLSFQVMYFWILLVFFVRRLRIKDPQINRPKINFLDVPNIIILAVEIFAMFFVFGYVTIYNWLGFNFFQSGINVLLRFAILFFLHFTIVELAFNQASKPESTDRKIYTRAILMAFLMYTPLLIPSISILLRAYKYAPYYIIPYLGVISIIVGFSIFGKKNAFQITIPIFFILLFWKYNMYYWILF